MPYISTKTNIELAKEKQDAAESRSVSESDTLSAHERKE